MILITGAGGVLGRALLALLAREGEPVTAASRQEVNLLDADATVAYFERVRPRIVYHLAAKVHGLGGNARYPADMFRDNIRINTNVIDAAHRSGCGKIVAVSTVAIYDAEAPKPVTESSIWMGEPHGGERAYGHAKRAMLAQLNAYAAQYGIDFAYPIMTNLYGPGDRFDPVYGHVIPSLVAKFHRAQREGGTVEVWGTGVAERDFLFADDAARAVKLVGEQASGPINVATGHTVTIRAVVQQLQALSPGIAVAWDSSKPNGELQRRYDVTKLEAIGFKPDVSLEEGLRRTAEWYAACYPDIRSYS